MYHIKIRILAFYAAKLHILIVNCYDLPKILLNLQRNSINVETKREIHLGMLVWSMYQHKRYLQTRYDMLQLRLLNTRQRISPHFIFNMLNVHIAKLGPKEGEQLTMLAHLLRANLDLTQKTFVTLAEELEFVEREGGTPV